MKYNKREQEAINALFEVATALKEHSECVLTYSQESAIAAVLGWSLAKTCTTKGNVSTFVRGKEAVIVQTKSCMKNGNFQPSYYRFFPFQVKTKNPGK